MAEHTLLDKKTPTVQQIADKHDVSAETIERQLAQGIKIEGEHTSDPKVAREIALDHLNEYPDYYTRLKAVEEDTAADREEGTESLVNKYKSETPGESMSESHQIDPSELRSGHIILGRDGKPEFFVQSNAVADDPRDTNAVSVQGKTPSGMYKKRYFWRKSPVMVESVILHETRTVKVTDLKAGDVVVSSSTREPVLKVTSVGRAVRSGWFVVAGTPIKPLVSFGVPVTTTQHSYHKTDDILVEWVRNPLCQQCSGKLTPKELNRGDRICLACVRINRGKIWDTTSEGTVVERRLKSFKAFGEQEQITLNPKTKNDPVVEVSPPGMEDWIRKNKSAFSKQYGADRASQFLYAAAWDVYNKKRSTVTESAPAPGK